MDADLRVHVPYFLTPHIQVAKKEILQEKSPLLKKKELGADKEKMIRQWLVLALFAGGISTLAWASTSNPIPSASQEWSATTRPFPATGDPEKAAICVDGQGETSVDPVITKTDAQGNTVDLHAGVDFKVINEWSGNHPKVKFLKNSARPNTGDTYTLGGTQHGGGKTTVDFCKQ